MPRTNKKRILFYRDYGGFTGGHLKVFDYFAHVKSSRYYVPEIYLTPSSRPDHLWRDEEGIVASYEPKNADRLFIAGLDWNALDSGIEDRVPVVNLIQHVRHATPDDPRYAFLSRHAMRICVSPEVADALQRTGRCNGPIHVIANGIDLPGLPQARPEDFPVFIAGQKRPSLAAALHERLKRAGISADCETGQIPRATFIERMTGARIVVTLPRETEGFFLPALEAMALGRAVVCPDCIGNRSFCIDGETCLMPPSDPDALAAAVMRLAADPALAATLGVAAASMSAHFDLRRERAEFLSILGTL